MDGGGGQDIGKGEGLRVQKMELLDVGRKKMDVLWNCCNAVALPCIYFIYWSNFLGKINYR